MGIGHAGDYYKGYIDDLRIYNRALSDSEVKTLYKQGTTPAITSITPIVAVLDQQTIFTVTGNNLPDGMGFTVGDCDSYPSSVEIPGTGSPTQRKFQCTPRGTAGQKTGFIKTKPRGERLYAFDVKIQPSADAPIIVDVNPKTAQLDQPTEFTVTGGNLTARMGFTIADCADSNAELTDKATAYSRTFVCTPRGTAGRKAGIVKTAPGELSVHYFDVVVKSPAAVSAAEPLLGAMTTLPTLQTLPVSAVREVTDTSMSFALNKTTRAQVLAWPVGTTVFKVGQLIRKVVATPVLVQGQVVITTGIATQDEWLDGLDINASINLTGNHFIPEGDNSPSATLQVRAVSAAELGRGGLAPQAIGFTNDKDIFEFTFTDHVLYDADGKASTIFDQLLVNGSLKMAKPKVTFKYSKSVLNPFVDMKFYASETFDLVYSSQKMQFAANKSVPLGSFVVPVPVSGGSVYGRLTLFLVFDAKGQAQITATFYQNATVDIGYCWGTVGIGLCSGDGSKQFGFFAHNNSSAVLQPPKPGNVKVTGSLNASLSLEAALKLMVLNYDLTGVDALAGPNFNVEGTVSGESTCFEGGLNVGADISAYAMLPEVTIPEDRWRWFDYEVSIVKQTAQVFKGNFVRKDLPINGCLP